MLVLVLLTAIGAVAVLDARQQPAPATVDVDALGPQIGGKVPDFELSDQDGRTQSLSTLRGPRGLVLVFSRSADW
jgi:cytochrome oxidase Cu insertion factor (SCO1/SenC/PrrC family)